MQKRVLSLAFSTLMGLGIAMAAPQDQQEQQAPPPPSQGQVGMRGGAGMMGDPDQYVGMLTKRLNLTDDQATQIRPIIADTVSRMQALRDDTSAPREKRAKMMSIRDDSSSKIKAVLNDTQRAQFEKMQMEQQQRMRDRMQQRQNGDSSNQ